MIRAEELMLGDIVTVNRSECVADGGQYMTWKQDGKIILIEKDYVRVQYEIDEEDEWDDWEEVGLEDIEPIPITPEILERNGFKLKEKGVLYTEYVSGDEHSIIEFGFYKESIHDIDTVLNCELGFVGGLDRIHHCHVKYVHELQHALRLCGISKNIEL